MQRLTTVEFRGDALFAVEEPDGVFVAVKPICQRFGLAWNGQLERIKRDPILLEGMREIRIPSPGGDQETVCLALRLINGWLFGIGVNQVKPELREDVLAYKRECYEALADRFLGPREAERPTFAPAGAPDADIRLKEWHEKIIGRTERIWGKAAARAQWVAFGYTDWSHLLPASDEPEDEGDTAEEEVPFDPAAVFGKLRTALREAAGSGIVPLAEAGDPATWGLRGVFGFRHPSGDYLIPLPAWRGLMAGQDERAAAWAFAQAGWLVRDREGRRAAVARIGGQPMRVYRIRAAFLADA